MFRYFNIPSSGGVYRKAGHLVTFGQESPDDGILKISKSVFKRF